MRIYKLIHAMTGKVLHQSNSRDVIVKFRDANYAFVNTYIFSEVQS